MRGNHERFPVGALLHLTVAGDDIGADIGAIEVRRDGHAHPNGQAMTQRPGARLDPLQLRARRVSVESAVRLDEGRQLLLGQQASFGECGVERGSSVALGQDHSVTRSLRSLVEDTEVERDKHVGDGELSPDVAHAGSGDHAQVPKPHPPGRLRELRRRRGSAHWPAMLDNSARCTIRCAASASWRACASRSAGISRSSRAR